MWGCEHGAKFYMQVLLCANSCWKTYHCLSQALQPVTCAHAFWCDAWSPAWCSHVCKFVVSWNAERFKITGCFESCLCACLPVRLYVRVNLPVLKNCGCVEQLEMTAGRQIDVHLWTSMQACMVQRCYQFQYRDRLLTCVFPVIQGHGGFCIYERISRHSKELQEIYSCEWTLSLLIAVAHSIPVTMEYTLALG